MIRYAGIKNKNIFIVSNKVFLNPLFDVVEIPKELDQISSQDLVINFKFKNGEFKNKKQKRNASDLKIAFVGNFGMRCGISTYSENLVPEIAKHIKEYKLFIEKNENRTENYIVDDEKIIECWKRGEPLSGLVKELKAYEPDIILIQHEFGIWPNARHWLSLMNQLNDFRVIVTMHSVFHHKDKVVSEAAMPEIIVHSEAAKSALKNEKKISSPVSVIPHGGAQCVDKTKLWNCYKSNKTFMQFGFGFRYKNWEACIEATAILKQKYNDIFFTGLFSESDFNNIDHSIYYNELMMLIEKLNVQENVAIIRGYQSDLVIDSYLRTNVATVFPYTSDIEHEVFGSSGAARIAMSKGLPIITSSGNHFTDLPSIKADTSQEIANALELIFTNNKYKNEQVEKQIKYLEETSWEKVANLYIKLFETQQ